MLTPEENDEFEFLDQELTYLEKSGIRDGREYAKMCNRFSELRSKMYKGSNVQGGESGLHPD